MAPSAGGEGGGQQIWQHQRGVKEEDNKWVKM